jgi:hypothetical protein
MTSDKILNYCLETIEGTALVQGNHLRIGSRRQRVKALLLFDFIMR